MSSARHWYTKWWGILLIIFGVLFLAFLCYIGVYTQRFYRQIQSGKMPAGVSNRLTHSVNAPPIGQVKTDLAYSAKDDPFFGSPSAPLRVVEFADFECSFSKDEAMIIRELQARFPSKIYFIYRDFPLSDIHPNGFRAAEAGQCANEQNKFWAMHDKLYQNAERLTDLDIKLYGLEIGLDIAQFNNCFDSRKYKDEIEIDRADGLAAGVTGTPTFFINGKRVPGAIPMEIWEKIILQVK